MLSRRTMREPSTGAFQTAVCTVLPCHATSRGRPTLTESKRAIISSPKDDHRKIAPLRDTFRPSEGPLGGRGLDHSDQVVLLRLRPAPSARRIRNLIW